MLEDQVANLLQRYLGNYVKGLNKEALKISVWQGDVELTNMQLKPEALNALKLPVKVKAGFLGSVKLKVPWSRLGQDPVLVSLDRIFLLAEPETQVEGSSEDAVQETKKNRVQEMEMKLLEKAQQLKSDVNKSWLGSLISTIIGNLKLSISNIHIRYEDLESNFGHPFAAGITLERLSAMTVDDSGKETFVTGGALDRIQKSVELDRLALYLDSDIAPWHVNKQWEDLLPSEWVQVFKFGTKDGKPANKLTRKHTYVLEPVSGNAKYSKLRQNEFADSSRPLHKAAVNLDDVTICLPKDGYRDVLKLADNFAAFNQRLKYAHYRPHVSVKSDPRSWWKFAYRVVSDQMKKASGKLSWEQVLKYARLRKRYISLYASLLRSDPSRAVVEDNKDIEELDRELDIELILQWRMLAHKFVEQSLESELDSRKQKAKKSWWSGWGSQSLKDENESFSFTDEDWKQLNEIIGYKESDDRLLVTVDEKMDALQTSLSISMKRNATKLIDESQECLAELSCEGIDCSIKLYPETKVFDLNLGSYKLSTPNGLLAESASAFDSLVGVFCFKPFDTKVDWSFVAKASPCYVTYLKDAIDQIVKFFRSNTVSQKIAMDTAAAVQMTIDGVKRTAQQQVNRALKDHSRFLLDLDIAAPKITIPTDFCPDNIHPTKLMLDLGNLVIGTKDDYEHGSLKEQDMYLQFNLVLSDVSAFLVDGDYCWGKSPAKNSAGSSNSNGVSLLPFIDKCGVILTFQQIRLESPSYPATRLAVRVPSLGFHFSPARYHRLMQVVKIFEEEDSETSDLVGPWNQADFEGWSSLLVFKGLGNREAVWQRRYLCLVGPFLYVLESPSSKSYKQCISLQGKHIYQVPPECVGDADLVLAVCDSTRANNKVVEDANALILLFDSDDSKKTWQSRLRGAIYRASGSAPVTGLSDTSSESEDSVMELNGNHDMGDLSKMERIFITGVLDELKVCVSYSYQCDQNIMKVLLTEERRLFELRAIGGQVEVSVRSSDIFIGTVLKSLEIEDLVSGHTLSQPRYLARSFIHSAETLITSDAPGNQSFDGSGSIRSEGDDKFYEATDNLVDSGNLILKSPSFTRIAGLLPSDGVQTTNDIALDDSMDSFVKAQVVIYDQNSPLYHNMDMQVTVTLATLSFFCRRPTILAIMEFANSITIKDESCEAFSDSSSTAAANHDTRDDAVDGSQSMAVSEPAVKGLLGKGKSRVVFNITLNMARAQILLMNEDETKLAVLSQDNLLTDIKVFPSSFSIKASLGNLKVSDESLPSSHMYFWACDMRNPGGSSFVELVFTSFSADDEDFEGYEYSLYGQLSEVRIVYLNRFIQEVVSYFMGLVPKNSKGVVKLKDQVTNSEKWFTTSDFEGSPAIKLDLSLRKPIILMPRRTDSLDYLKLDIVHITVKSTSQWFGGSRSDINAVHMEVLTVQVEDINLNVGCKGEIGESIIQDVKGVSVVIQRSLRDLMHQIPNVEVLIKMEKLKAALSNREYQIITDCAQSNVSETPHTVPPLNLDSVSSLSEGEAITQDPNGTAFPIASGEARVMMKVCVVIDLVELCLHTGLGSLATVQVTGAWLLYKTNTLGEGFLSATLKGFTVLDDREGTKEEFRLAIGKPENIGSCSVDSVTYDDTQHITDGDVGNLNDISLVPTMLIVDAKFCQLLTSVSLCIQRPQLLVALDFLLAVAEFFVPTVSDALSTEEVKNSVYGIDAIILNQSTYKQPSTELSLTPLRPLVVDDERYDHFVYDGNGGILHLKDRRGSYVSGPSTEAIIYIGDGKRLQFKNVVIKNGLYLDSCISMGSNSSYSALKEDQVYIAGEDEVPNLSSSRESPNNLPSQSIAVKKSTEFIIELQVVGPELTFYNTSEKLGESLMLSNQLLHAQLDGFCRLVLKGDAIEMNANVLGFTMESNGIRILEPFDASVKYSNASGRTNIHLSVSDIFMNFSFSILRLFLAVEEDILAFLSTTSKKITVVCSQFDKIGTIKDPSSDQIYAFWRPHAPPGFAVLGDYLTPLDKPPTKAVLAVNTNFSRVKKPLSYKLIWPPLPSGESSLHGANDSDTIPSGVLSDESSCSIWFPEAPAGYVALGCVVCPGRAPPPLSSAFCISASLVSPCSLRDCIAINTNDPYQSSLAFWRVDNSVGTFLPADLNTSSITGGAYDLRHIIFGFPEASAKSSNSLNAQTSSQSHNPQSERSATVNSGRRYEAVASFRLIWWNQGSNSRKRLSIWRPVVPPGMIYFGDIAVKGYEPPNSCIVLHDTEDEELFKAPLDYQIVGQIKKQRGMESVSFWLPQAPPGFVSLGCIACKGTPKQSDFSSLRCIRSDLVTGDEFLEESIWDTSDAKLTKDSFSVWAVGNELSTFLVRGGLKKPPRRFALKLADSNVPTGSDDTVIDAEIRTFSAALFDDYGGLMVPLCNLSLSGIGFGLHGRTDYLNSTVSFSLAARSYNDKYEVWEPLVEPVDGFLRYQYDLNAPSATSQLRVTSTRDLNLNVSVSNANMIIQAYASWNSLVHVPEYHKKREAFPPTDGERSVIDIHHRRNYDIIPQNKLGQDIFIRATESRGLTSIIKMSSGDVRPVKVPVSKNMLDSHLKGKLFHKVRTMVTFIIVDGQFPRVRGLTSPHYTLAIRLIPDQSLPSETVIHQQSARTCGSSSNHLSPELELVKWNEIFFFKVDAPDYYSVELLVTDMGKAGVPLGFFSAPLKQIVGNFNHDSYPYDNVKKWTSIELSSAESVDNNHKKLGGKIRCAVLLSPRSEGEISDQYDSSKKKSGFIQISPRREGPWTTVRLNYAAPAACWRLGNDVVASEVRVRDGNRYVNIRSLVSVRNSTDFVLDLCLVLNVSMENVSLTDNSSTPEGLQTHSNKFQTDEFLETEKYSPTTGWVGSMIQPSQDMIESGGSHQEFPTVELPPGWEWVDDWHLDMASIDTADGWVYAPDIKSLKWPESFDPLRFVNYARQRRWIRNRKQSTTNQEIYVGTLKPGDTIPLPLYGLTQPGLYVLRLRPCDLSNHDEYSWSSVVDGSEQPEESGSSKVCPEISVSSLIESEKLLYCSQISSTSSSGSHKLWFCTSIQATEIAKDIHSDPIQDWNLVVKSPLSISNFLPLAAEFSVLEMQESGGFVACFRGVFFPGKSVNVFSADIRKPLYFSLLPQRGWLPIHEAVLLSHPHEVSAKTINLRSSISGRIVQIILEQNSVEERPLQAKIIRLYAPYWFSIARCPPLTFRLVDIEGKKNTRKIGGLFQSKKINEVVLEEITEEEIYEGHTIASALNFKMLGLAVSIDQSGNKQFGPVKDLSPLGDMDGSLDVHAYDGEGNCMQLFITTKPCLYQSVPTKVISVRPFMTFTNRLGRDVYIKLCSEDEPKVLRPCDSRISFVYRVSDGPNKLQVRLGDTNWSFPIHIVKEDTISLVLRRHNGTRTFLRTEIRGYEEGSRFIIVFRLGSSNGPIRIENRTVSKTLSFRQSGFGEDAWVPLEPFSTTNFAWEDPYGQRFIEAKVDNDLSTGVWELDLETAGICSSEELGLQFHVVEIGDIRIARFSDTRTTDASLHEQIRSLQLAENCGPSNLQNTNQNNGASPLELIIEFGVVGLSIIDHRPKEVSYFYFERVFVSYSTGYDGGMTSRFKLILGHVQLDNQLPLTLMPVLLAPEPNSDMHHPVVKMTITMRNENTDGIQVYPYIYIRVTEKCWRLNIHEPIIWALVDLYNNLQLDRLPKSSSVTEVDPEIRIDLVDISEVRLKVSLETAPAQRPHGVLGVWSPILSAVGNAFKIQVHLRRVMHKDRFMRRSSIVSAIGNRVWRDLIHNPLHLIFSVDVLGMTSSTLASLSKGFAELSTDGQFTHLRSKQVFSRRITGVGDGIIQGTEAFVQGVAFGVSGVVKKPVESARQNGLSGLVHGIGRAFLGVIVQPMSGALDFFSLTVDGIGASFSKCLEVFNSKTTFQRIRNPRAIRANGILTEYSEREAVGQMILYLAEAHRHFGCTEIFKEPSKFAWSDYYEEHFVVPYQRIVLVTNKRVMLLQCLAPDKMDKKPCKIMWDVPWEELIAVELAKAGHNQPSHLILHLKSFRRSENFVRVIKCSVEDEVEGREPQAVRICSAVCRMWNANQSAMKSLMLKVPSSQRHVYFAWSEAEGREKRTLNKAVTRQRELPSYSSASDGRRFVKHSINFSKIWSSEQESRGRCTLCKKQVLEDAGLCSIWRPICPDGYVSIGDIAHIGSHPPNVAAVYRKIDRLFALPVGYDLVWRNCLDDYATPVSIWHPRAPEGFVSPGCIAVAGFVEPEPDLVHCVAISLAEETEFEEQKVWSAPDSYPWACHIYQVRSEALHFVALRTSKEESDWKPMRILDDPQPLLQSLKEH
ncbi:hypothetical protein ABKV19_012985 [Rosa sericea]